MSITYENVKVNKIVYFNQQNSWGVFSIELPAKENDPVRKYKSYNTITVAGNFNGIYEECIVTVTGEQVEHPKYGPQIQLTSYVIHEDNSSKESIINFLTKSTIRGIRVALATKIYDKFKEDSIHIVLHDTERLKEIDGIGEKTFKVVSQSVADYIKMEELLNYCAKIGLNKYNLIMQIYKEFGDEAVSLLQSNPYQLLEMTETLSFKQIDEIAKKAGVPDDDDNRLMYGLLYVLRHESILCGSTGCSDVQLKDSFLKTLGIGGNQLYRYALSKLAESKQVYRDDNNVFLKDFYESEQKIANKLCELSKPLNETFKMSIIDEEMNNFEGFTLNIGQQQAIRECLNNQVNVITACAGAGKSTISKAILRIFDRHGYNLILLSPTAKAAKRLNECTGYQTSTIHKFLKITDSTLRSKQPVEVPEGAVILVDEASMVDIRLFEKLLDVMLYDTRLILVGDIRQLPSVQAGNLLEDIINSKGIPVSYLTEITRQADGSNIIKYSNMATEGRFIPSNLRSKDVTITDIRSDQRLKVVPSLCKTYKECIKEYGLLNVQVICAYKNGVLGVNNLNKALKEAINPTKPAEDDIFPFHIGDKVRQTMNDYDLEVFNGETGMVSGILRADDEKNITESDILIVDFGDREVFYDKIASANLTLSYASTVHSSQGSEYGCVFVILDNEISNILLVRKIVYTAITRAKSKCYILGIDGCVNLAISNNHYKERLTKLEDFIKEKSGEMDNGYNFN